MHFLKQFTDYIRIHILSKFYVCFEITQDHIDKGLQCVPDQCPIALALKDRGFKDVTVEVHYVIINNFRYDHSHESFSFRLNYDYDNKVEPCKLTLSTI